ncbi:hypothetical protein KP509_35G028200 [Ceratopteris richardii]|uniref:Uncharacterized protein n=1 Tax=Ceratopteris richardii TaxID=49495 RepID=A0A8T2QE32_CERRI|nr:hypothetical protein KP509_35G028200 [Ceratopteris richardii]
MADDKGLLWRLPVVRTPELGKLGPGFGYGIGCGAGLGVGIIGGAGLGFGFPGLHFGAGLGAGCGVGIGFGYGLGKGISYDENGRHSNIPKLRRGDGSTGSEIGGIIDDFFSSVKQAFDNLERDISKRRR